jgi:hypothetical protein
MCAPPSLLRVAALASFTHSVSNTSQASSVNAPALSAAAAPPPLAAAVRPRLLWQGLRGEAAVAAANNNKNNNNNNNNNNHSL